MTSTALDPGKLNRRITIQSQTTTQDGFGQQVSQWSTVLTAWASIRPATGKEVYATSGFVSELSHIVTTRYTSVPIKPGARILYGSRVLLVQAVSDPDEAHVQLNLMCLELND